MSPAKRRAENVLEPPCHGVRPARCGNACFSVARFTIAVAVVMAYAQARWLIEFFAVVLRL
jgi:hypothetical protein